MKARSAYCEQAANAYFKKAGLTIPVDVEQAARFVKLEIVYRRRLVRSGLLSSVDSLIYVRSTDSVFRQRFTIAHEIGHHVLGHYLERDRLSEEDDDGNPYWETEADRFAGALLMPKADFLHDYRKSADISGLSQKYMVSASAVSVRLSELHLL